MYRNFLYATSAFSQFSSASAWALPEGHSCFRLPAALVWTVHRLLGKYLLCHGDLFPLSSDLGVPSPFFILLCVPSSPYCLLAFPFVRHVFSESPSPWLQGSVMPQGWSMGMARMIMSSTGQPQASLHGGCPCSYPLPILWCHRHTVQWFILFRPFSFSAFILLLVFKQRFIIQNCY